MSSSKKKDDQSQLARKTKTSEGREQTYLTSASGENKTSAGMYRGPSPEANADYPGARGPLRGHEQMQKIYQMAVEPHLYPCLASRATQSRLKSDHKVNIEVDDDQRYIITGSETQLKAVSEALEGTIVKSVTTHSKEGESTDKILASQQTHASSGSTNIRSHAKPTSHADTRDTHVILDENLWHYCKEMHSSEIMSIKSDCMVDIKTSIHLEICPNAKDKSRIEEAEIRLQQLMLSCMNVKKTTLVGIYDTNMLKQFYPDVFFQNSNRVITVLGPEKTLKKLSLFLKDSSLPLEHIASLDENILKSLKPHNDNIKATGTIFEAGADPTTPGNVRSIVSGTRDPDKPKSIENDDKKLDGSEDRSKSGQWRSRSREDEEAAALSQTQILKRATQYPDEESDDSDTDSEDVTAARATRGRARGDTPTLMGHMGQMLCGYTHKKHGQHIIICTANITQLHVDAIVNAANEHLKHEGGVAKAIAEVAGPKLQQECTSIIKKRRKPLQAGDNEFTKAYKLPCNHVIHAVGPRYFEYKGNEKLALTHLRKTVRNVLQRAEVLSVASIALPAISSGHFGMPWEYVVSSMFDSITNFCSNKTKVKIIVLVDLSSKLLDMIQQKCSSSKIFSVINTETLQHIYNRFNPTANKQMDEQYHQQSKVSEKDGLQKQSKHTHINITEKAKFATPDSEIGDRKTTGSVKPKEAWTEPPGNELMEDSGIDRERAVHGIVGTKKKDFISGQNAQESKSVVSSDIPDECAICLEIPVQPSILSKCKHIFCNICISKAFEFNPVCPTCGTVYGERTGNQPENGKMSIIRDSRPLPGYEKHGTFVITYSFPAGVQTEDHPEPGKRYAATSRTAYLPDTKEGKRVLHLLQKAFDARLTFTVGTSVTTGREGQVTWNDIHHKTNITGGSAHFGYPDPTYLKRVQEELAAKGIV